MRPALKTSLDLLRLVQEEFYDVVPAFGVIKEDEEGPVDEPRPLLQ